MATPFPFGSGNTLLASQLNAITTLVTSTKTASHTLTIADVGTRVIMNSASATTITVNTSIFGASDVVEILNIGAGVCTVTAGTCTVGTSGTLALAQNAGGTLTFISASASVFVASAVASALVVVQPKTAFTTTTTFNADNVFSATYDNYLIQMVVNTTASNGYLTYRMRVGGVADSTANYTSIEAEAVTSTISASTTTAATSGQVMFNFAAGLQFANFIISQPATTNFTQIQSSGIRFSPGWSNIYGQHRVATAFDGIGFISGSNLTGYYTIYGYSKS